MTDTVFLRVLHQDDKAAALKDAVDALRQGLPEAGVSFVAAPADFRQVPGSPFAYWVGERIRRLFTELPPLEGDGRTVRVGLQTGDDFRFVRAWWEVADSAILTGAPGDAPEAFRQRTFHGARWAPFAKGGAYSPFYSDVHLVVDWTRDGAAIREFRDLATGGLLSRPQNLEFFFRPGLTWPLRAGYFSPAALPNGCVFSARGYAMFTEAVAISGLLEITSARVFDLLFKIFLGRAGYPEFVVGVAQSLPVPAAGAAEYSPIGGLAASAARAKMSLDTAIESAHPFVSPLPAGQASGSLAALAGVWQERREACASQVRRIQEQVDEIVYGLYGLGPEDRRALELALPASGAAETADADEGDGEEDGAGDDADQASAADAPAMAADLLSYTLGCAFGRWDIRFATGEKAPPDLPDPWDPLPACPPGMLQGEDGLPLTQSPPGYPLDIQWEGILVDDPDHPADILGRVRLALEVIWGERAAAIETEAAELLGAIDLRDYFRRPGAGGFWTDHVHRYSKSRRKAPIYWLLQSSKKSYGLWIDYHRLDGDILAKALVQYVEPKIRLEQSRLERLQQEREAAGPAGRAAREKERQIDRQETLLSEIEDFAGRLRQVVDMHLQPDLNDGVILNLAPLHDLCPWPEPGRLWKELVAGKYEWSSVGKQLKERGLAAVEA